MPKYPILYSFRRCPYAMRARLAIVVSGQRVELREILLRDKAPELIEASPKATVPVLIDVDGSVIEESLDIMNWALAKSDPDNWLVANQDELQQIYVLVEQCEMEFKTHLDRYKYANRYEEVDGEYERMTAGKFLWLLNQRLENQLNLFSQEITLADMAIFTFVRQFANVDRNWFDQQEWHHLLAWLNRLIDSDRFQKIMGKYEIWKAGDPPILFGE